MHGTPSPNSSTQRCGEMDHKKSTTPSTSSSSASIRTHRQEIERYDSSQQPRWATKPTIGAHDWTSESKSAQNAHFGFKWKSLWMPAVVNPLNGKSHTFPLLRLWDPYAKAFWLGTLGFFVAFFGWFAAAGLMTEAITDDLKLTMDQVSNSNLASLGGTAIVRVFAGYFVDRFGPRKVMASLLILGAVPTALMATVTNVGGLEAARFFISILGGNFVPCQAWTSTFFDKNIIGTANAFAGGWGNLGGGVTGLVILALYDRLRSSGLTSHIAWRICFVIVPVPMLLLLAVVILLLGRDHPAGKWSQRHELPGTAYEITAGREIHLDSGEISAHQRMQFNPSGEVETPRGEIEREETFVLAALTSSQGPQQTQPKPTLHQIDTVVPEALTLKTAGRVLIDLRVWMVVVSYMLSFGLETAMDTALPELLYALFESPTFASRSAAFAASLYGLLNLIFPPLGGVLADKLYRTFQPSGYGLRAKVVLMLTSNILQGLFLIGLGLYVDRTASPTLSTVLGFIVLIAAFGFIANAGAYSIYGHLRPKNVGFCAGLVGSGGNIGGLMYIGVFKNQPGSRVSGTLGHKLVIAGIFNTVAVATFSWVPLGDAS
ncbi:unnamed protein product [Sympodiomycopsis kandeliae]